MLIILKFLKLGCGLTLWCIVFNLSPLTAIFKATEPPDFQFLTQDSVEVEVYSVLDADRTLKQYRARVFTPICEDSICYSVELDFYWDILGNFQEYDLVPGKPLTKIEHDPFTEEDYRKLGQILSNKQPAFANMKKEELITKVVNDSIDGITGATVAAVRDETIPGAAYSCYTLWHIAHGAVVDSIQQHTQRKLDAALVNKLSTLEEEEAHFFLINSFTENDFEIYLSEVLNVIDKNGPYFAKQAIEKLPGQVLAMKKTQDFFAKEFIELGYFAQVSLLKRLEHSFISEALANTLVSNLNNRGSSQNEAIIRLIGHNANVLELHTVRNFLEQIIAVDLSLSPETYNAVLSYWQHNDHLKKDLKAFKKAYKKQLKAKK